MKQVRITHPVMGMIVTAMIGMGCLAAAPATRSTRSDIIRPGEGVGPVSFGMTDVELEQALGKPATVPWKDVPNARQYPSKSMKVFMTKTAPHTVVAIFAGGRADNLVSSLLMGPLPWKTEEGLGIGSTAEDITAAYGPPSDDQNQQTADWRMMSYTDRGIQFGLEGGQVVFLDVRKPVAAK